MLIGAGLPILPGMAGESKSYAERLFSFPDIGPLSEDESARAIKEPIEAAGEAIEANALEEIFWLTQGYPYFLQEWGYQAWNHAEFSPITVQMVQETTLDVERRLDENFFRKNISSSGKRTKRTTAASSRTNTCSKCAARIGNDYVYNLLIFY